MAEVRLFLVRVWSQLNGFRASVRSVEDEQTHSFDTPAQLVRFMADQARVDEPPAESPRTTRSRVRGQP